MKKFFAALACTTIVCSALAQAPVRQVSMQGLMCDTPDQVTWFVSHAEDVAAPNDALIDAINKKAGGPACLVAQYVGVPSDKGAVVTDSKGQQWQLWHVVLSAFIAEDTGKLEKFDPPIDQWTATFLPSDPA